MTHSQFMSHALELALCGRYTASPNPMVGCVIVKNNQIIGKGFHQKWGDAHAEINALKEAGADAKDATLYVTLEPCCHVGKTPPCTTALIQAGIKKIIVACLDPNPLVSGKGIHTLRSAGMEVEIGLEEIAAKKINEIFFYYIQHHRPFVIAKWAMSLDGRMNVNPGDSPYISCPESQVHSHDIRQQVDAIMVGSKTAILDNPRLTRRPHDTALKQPVRIIVCGKNALPLHLALFDPRLPGKTIIASTQKNHREIYQSILSEKMEFLFLPGDEESQVDLNALLDALGKKNMSSLLVEGGTALHRSFFKEKLVNKIQVYLSPSIMGSDKRQPVDTLTSISVGADFFLTADMVKQ